MLSAFYCDSALNIASKVAKYKETKKLHTCVVFHQVFHDLEVSVEASCSQRGRVGLRRRVYVRSTLHQQADNLQVTCDNFQTH